MKRFATLIAAVMLLKGALFAQVIDCGHDSVYLKTPANKTLYEEFSKTINQWRDNNPGTNYLPNPPSGGGGENGLQISPGCPYTKLLIPVVFHVVHGSGESYGQGGNITESQVQDAIDWMNKYYRNALLYSSPAVNTGIQFCLAKKKPDGTPFNVPERKLALSERIYWGNFA